MMNQPIQSSYFPAAAGEVTALTGDYIRVAGEIAEMFSEKFLYEVINGNPNLILVKDQAGKFILANKAAAELYGSIPAEMVGKCDADFNSNQEELDGFREIDRSVLESSIPLHIDAEKVTDAAGKIRWFQTIKKPIVINEGEAPHLLVVCSDITEHKETQRALKKAKEKAIKASRAKSEFLTRMSHELRTPLNAILGFNQLLQQDDNLNEAQIEALNIINTSGKHLLNLISEILDMSKVELGGLELKLGPVDIRKLGAEVIALFEARACANDCRLSLVIDPHVPQYISTDEQKIRQVMMNLISNAVKFTQDGSVQLSISPVAANQRLRVTVADTGPGISKDEIHQVFGLFRQTLAGKKSEAGAGLGLSISQKLVQFMRGEIGVVSELGKGSVFHFEVPLTRIEVGETVQPAIAEAARPAFNGHGYKVLIADDAVANRKFVNHLLSRLGFQIFEAVNGLEAVKSRFADQPDVILMDIKMPEMDGMTATATIREREEHDQINRVPVIALTANAFEEHRQNAARVGCDAFIAKPFEFADLINTISALIPQAGRGN